VRKRLGVLVGLATLSMAAMLAVGGTVLPAGAAPPDDGIPVVPVQGRGVGNGLREFVHVFYGKDEHPGKPGGGSVVCTDNDEQTGAAVPFAFAGPVGLRLNPATVPSGLNVSGALQDGIAAWNSEGASLGFATTGTAARPAQDGASTIGWVRLAPKNVLAATWTWVNASNQVVEADVFFNSGQPWATFNGCPTARTGRFDVGNIAVHEFGHVLGLEHYSDSGAQASMYPSAPADEIRKRTLTLGDIAALDAALGV
jgi:hypothetical protein